MNKVRAVYSGAQNENKAKDSLHTVSIYAIIYGSISKL